MLRAYLFFVYITVADALGAFGAAFFTACLAEELAAVKSVRAVVKSLAETSGLLEREMRTDLF